MPNTALTSLENAAGTVLQTEKNSQIPVLTIILSIKKTPEGSRLTSKKSLVIGSLNGIGSGATEQSGYLQSTLNF